MTEHPQPPGDRPNVIPWPPLLYAMAFFIPWALQYLIDLPVLDIPGLLGQLQAPVGWALVATGVMVAYLAIRSFMAVGTAVHPTHPASALVTFGLYNRTRNPMYLAAVVAFAGLALATGNLFRFAALPLLVLGLNALAILPEENYLSARFGADWDAYRAKTPRWW